MTSLLSLAGAALVTAAALALLMLAVSRLGRTLGLLAALQVMGLMILKFAVLALGLGWMSKQPWFKAPAAAFGIAIPLAALMIWKGRSLKTEKNHG